MRIVGTRDVDEVDVFPLYQLSPVRFDRRVTPLVSECLRTLGIASADGLKDRNVRHVEEAARLQKCVRVRAPHEAVPDKTDVEILFCHLCMASRPLRLHYLRLRCFGLAVRGQPLMLIPAVSVSNSN